MVRKPRKPGTFRAGDIVNHKGGHTTPLPVSQVLWTPNGDWILLQGVSQELGPFPADNYEIVSQVRPSPR